MWTGNWYCSSVFFFFFFLSLLNWMDTLLMVGAVDLLFNACNGRFGWMMCVRDMYNIHIQCVYIVHFVDFLFSPREMIEKK